MKLTPPFQMKQFTIRQDKAAMKVGTDGLLLGAWAPVQGASRILDVGTGTGLLALMLAQRAPAASITAVEIEATAFGQAEENVLASPFAAGIRLLHVAFQDFAARHPAASFDLVVSNPPYFSNGVKPANTARELARNAAALPPAALLQGTRKLLVPGGRLAVVLPIAQEMGFVDLAKAHRLFLQEVCELAVNTSKPASRVLLLFGQQPACVHRQCLAIYEVGQGYKFTEEYKNLTRDFHTIF